MKKTSLNLPLLEEWNYHEWMDVAEKLEINLKHYKMCDI